MTHRPFRTRIAAAPISWGVCEVPGWGHQLTPHRVLTEMRSLGLAATEFGPDGFLADGPAARAAQLRSYGLTAVGGFHPALMHDPDHDPLPGVDDFIDFCLAADARVMVLAAASGVDGYEARPEIGGEGWKTMLRNLDRVDARAAQRGVLAALHPHVGTMVQSGDETERVLRHSRIGLCVDTGHLAVGGADALKLAETFAHRVVHAHLKDVDEQLAERLRSGDLGYAAAVRQGLFRPLGHGDAPVAAMIQELESAGYDGWYVLEQDVMLAAEPAGEGPVTDVRESLDNLLEFAA